MKKNARIEIRCTLEEKARWIKKHGNLSEAIRIFLETKTKK
jgi:predicted RNA-binding protein YlqC (UPF0109 family)